MGAPNLKLLVATDGSENALRAVRHVTDLARRGVAVHAVLCNVQLPVMSGEVGVIAPIEIAERQRTLAAGAAIASAARLLENAGVEVSTHEATGVAADEIVAAAEAHGCDGIVMGSRGHGALASLLLGSVSSQVARKAFVPVTLVN